MCAKPTKLYDTDKAVPFTDFIDVHFIEVSSHNNLELQISFYNNPSSSERTYSIEIPNIKPIDFQDLRNEIRKEYNKYYDQIEKLPKSEKEKKKRLAFNLASECAALWRKISENDSNKEENMELWDILFGNPNPNKTLLFKSKQFVIPIRYLIRDSSLGLDEILASKFKIRMEFLRRNNEEFKLTKRPKVLFIYDKQLKGALDELQTLQGLEKDEFIYLTSISDSDIQDSKDLVDKIISQEFNILHFASHVYHPSDSNSYIKLGTVTFKDSHIHSIKEKLAGTLVHLNGCKTELFDVNRTHSLTKEFLDKETSAIICVDMEVNDKLASNFSEKLYNRLFRKKCYMSPEGHCGINNVVNCKYTAEKILQCISMEIMDEDYDVGGYFYSIYGKAKFN